MNEYKERYAAQMEELALTAQRTAELGFVSSHGGNLSFRVEDDIVLITPTKVAKRHVTPEKVCIVRMNGEVLYAAEGLKPTGELPFHLRIFSKRPDVRGIVHAHPPVLTGFAIAHTDLLEKPILPEPVLEVGPILTVPYAEPLRDELAEAFDAYIDKANGFLMKNHGALMVATEGVERALDFLEMMEAAAQSIVTAMTLGSVDTLSEQDVRNLDRTMATRSMPMPGLPGRVKSLAELYFK